MTARRLLLLLLLTGAAAVAACREPGVTITPLDPQGNPLTPAPLSPRGRGQPTPTPVPRPPAVTMTAFRPANGYTSMAADRRGVYWLGGGIPLRAAVMASMPAGADERELARPGPDEAVGRPLPAGDWLVFPQTAAAPASGDPWSLRAVNLVTNEVRRLDGAAAGWDGLSHATSGTRVLYTTNVGSGAELASEVRLWDSVDDSRRTVLRTPAGVTLQRIAFDGQSAAAVRFTRRGDGTVATDVVEVDVTTGQVLPLPAENGTLPAISTRWIAWVTMPVEGRANQLVLYDRRQRSARVVAGARPGHSLHNPSITGDLVTWNSTDTSEIAVHDAAQRATFVLDRGVVGKVWAHEGTLVWTALNTYTNRYEIKVGRIEGGP